MNSVTFRITHADGRIEERALPEGRYRVGREVGDLVLPGPNTSATHAEIEVSPSGVHVTDLGSTNGTFTSDGARLIAPHTLRLDEIIRFGSSTVQLLAARPQAGGTQVMPQFPNMQPIAPVSPPPVMPPGAPPVVAAVIPSPGAPDPGSWGVNAGAHAQSADSAPRDAFGLNPGAVPPVTGIHPPGGGPVLEYAQWPQRVIGYLIDYLFVVGVTFVLYGGFILFQGVLLSASSASSDAAAGMLGGSCCFALVLFPLSTLAVGMWNRVYLVSKRGYSIGQGMSKLSVVTATGGKLTFGMALVRLLAQIGISMLPFGLIIDLLWPLWDERRQTLHDKAVNSYVVLRPS